tara:strand:+ start:122 stop:493 length:372 start_codon:yes stop_codon:yes gene_type:complete
VNISNPSAMVDFIMFIKLGERKMNKVKFSIDGLHTKVLSDILLSKNNMEFVDYVNTFYGSNSIYGEEAFPSTGGVTKAEIILAIKIRMLMNIKLPFEGDSMDREIIRDIMIEAIETKAVTHET